MLKCTADLVNTAHNVRATFFHQGACRREGGGGGGEEREGTWGKKEGKGRGEGGAEEEETMMSEFQVQ